VCAITWDEVKRLKNLAKHGIDLADCGLVFSQTMVTREDSRETYGEIRLQSIGLLREHIVLMI
jgi:uncharacterized DUF497 family protein